MLNQQQLQTVQHAISLALSDDKSNHQVALMSLLDADIRQDYLAKLLIYLNCINAFYIDSANAMLILQEYRDKIADKNLMIDVISAYLEYSVELDEEEADLEFMEQIGLLEHKLKKEIFPIELGLDKRLIEYAIKHQIELSDIYHMSILDYDSQEDFERHIYTQLMTVQVFEQLAANWANAYQSIYLCINYNPDFVRKCCDSNPKIYELIMQFCKQQAINSHDNDELSSYTLSQSDNYFDFLFDMLGDDVKDLRVARFWFKISSRTTEKSRMYFSYCCIDSSSRNTVYININDIVDSYYNLDLSISIPKSEIKNAYKAGYICAEVSTSEGRIQIDNIPFLYGLLYEEQK